jgi:ABC-type spermidine/putrescine transport system permease subunit II
MTAPPVSPRLRAWRRRMTLIRVLACAPALALVAFVLIAPVGWLSWLSVRDSNGFTFRHYARMLANPGYAASLKTTLEVAALVTLLSGLMAYPVALLLARLRGWRARPGAGDRAAAVMDIASGANLCMARAVAAAWFDQFHTARTRCYK